MITVTRHTRYRLSESGRTFDLLIEPVDSTDILFKQFPDGRAVVGYLAQDEDCSNPLEDCDGMGKIVLFRDSKVMHEALTAIGCEQYGNRDPDMIPNPFAVILDRYEHGQVAYSVHGEGTQDRWDTSRGAAVWIPDDECLKHILSSAIAKMLPEGVTVNYLTCKTNPDGTCITRPCKPGERGYFKNPDGSAAGTVPDERYFNVITYQLPNGKQRGGFKTFETAYRAAARALGIRIDRTAKVKLARAVAVECARQACEEFSAWCNGECYGHIVLVFDKDNNEIPNDHDSCWGFIGSEYAEQELKTAFDSAVKTIEDELLPGINAEPAKEDSDVK